MYSRVQGTSTSPTRDPARGELLRSAATKTEVERQRRVITFSEALATGGVALDVRAATAQDAVEKVATLLRNDPRVLDWEVVYSSLANAVTCLVEDGADFGVCIPHARTNAVTAMVMSAGR